MNPRSFSLAVNAIPGFGSLSAEAAEPSTAARLGELRGVVGLWNVANLEPLAWAEP